jgi:hypothetical protein
MVSSISKRPGIQIIAFLIFFCTNAFPSDINSLSDTTKDVLKKPLRTYQTTRLTTEKPVIDGILNDSCWKSGEWASDFIQWIPNEGAKPSSPTFIKIIYDNKNIYVAIRAVDYEPQKISRKAGRRDEFNGDAVGINFDSYHDHRTGFEFNVTAAGQKIDLVLTNPMNADFNWNAVWSAKTGIEDSAWVVEYEIPLSQLRYSNDVEQTWGMHCWRWIDRLQEESDWEPQSSTGPGMLYLFGELHGISGLPKSRRIEIMPYALGKLKTYKKDPDNPFADKGKTWSGKAGIDAKIGLSSNFTADLTINPDFGQVESDPSVMNLTAFETFYDEKRPFFLEGKNIFSFDFDNVNLFYSRRIGHVPGYYPDLNDNEHINFPDNTAILGAAKLSGKTSNGLSIGVLESVSRNEHAKIDSAGTTRNLGVDPMTNYSIIRVQQDFKQGTTVLGGILTSTNRIINDPQLRFMNRDAFTGGLDLLHQWHDKEFYVDTKLVGSDINGYTDAISELQKSSARYYQRQDINYIHYDSTRKQLTGYGGKLKIGKGSKGLWRYSTEFDWRSPGLDLNDIGFMQTADIIKQVNAISYFINQPVSIFRTYSIGINETNNWDFGMRHISSGGSLNIYLEFVNKWSVNTSVYYTSQALDTRILRGGDAMLVPAVWEHYLYMKTDPSRRIFFDCTTDITTSQNQNSRYYSFQPGLSVRPVNTLKVSVSFNYSDNMNKIQYIDTKSVNDENIYLLGKLNQYTVVATFRIDYNITPNISIQYYGSPFATTGKYNEFKTVIRPGDSNYDNRFNLIHPVLNGEFYEASENKNSQVEYTFENPDFNFSQFRSNLVFRWEYRPGSQIYLVWSQDRTGYIQPGTDSVNESFGKIKKTYPDNIFLIKINYWFSL